MSVNLWHMHVLQIRVKIQLLQLEGRLIIIIKICSYWHIWHLTLLSQIHQIVPCTVFCQNCHMLSHHILMIFWGRCLIYMLDFNQAIILFIIEQLWFVNNENDLSFFKWYKTYICCSILSSKLYSNATDKSFEFQN